MPDVPHTPALQAQAMVLAAGRGERMRPLSDHCPKPLLAVGGKPLMQYHLEALARSGVHTTLVNTAWLGEKIDAYFGHVFGLQSTPSLREQLSKSEHDTHPPTPMQLRYSHEGRDFGGALETAGGIVRALPGLADVFWVVAGDVFAPDFAFSPRACQGFAASPQLAHLWLVPNPAHNLGGDFGISPEGLAWNLPPSPASHTAPARYTFSTIALYKRAFFEAPWCPIPAGNPAGVTAPLAPMLRAAMDRGAVGASLYTGAWTDVGTPARLAQLDALMTDKA